ncbi:MAG: HDOD domain-containing protein [Hahellaceae bacterium]|nr:HDOD domain-containing protein [Hahellaceae bacterium]
MPIDQSKLTRLVETLPAFPESAQKIIALTSRVDCSPKQLVKIIEHDPVLTMKVLKLVNSAYFGLSREVKSVNHAVVYVGINTIKNLAISVATTGTLPKQNAAGLDTRALWYHSLKVGVLAKILAEEHGTPSTQTVNYFVGGLLHDIGRLLVAHFFPDEYKSMLSHINASQDSILESEALVLGITHAEIGAMVSEHWQLPAELQHCIRHHHSTQAELLVNAPLTMAVNAANLLIHLKDEPEKITIPECILQWLGAPVEDVLARLTTLENEVDKAVSFIEIAG